MATLPPPIKHRNTNNILAQANSKVKAPRLMSWWDARPADIDPAAWAQHCAAHIDKRGLAEIQALVAA